MTQEQQNLLMDNINAFYKCCAEHNIYDEDDRQSILLKLCKAMQSYNPERGAITTFIYNVVYHEKIRLWRQNKDRLENTSISFEEVFDVDDEEGCTLADFIGDDEMEYNWAEDRLAYKQILESYKKRFPKTWEKDIAVVKAITEGKQKIDIVKECHVPYCAISPAFLRVTKYFRNKVAI